MKDENSKEMTAEEMLQADLFSQWLGIQILDLRHGYCKLKMKVTKEMLNGFGIAHGGIAFSLADSALAFASNTNNNKAVSIEASISFIKPVFEHETLFAVAEQKSFNHRLQVFDITITKENGELSALFRGMVKRTEVTKK